MKRRYFATFLVVAAVFFVSISSWGDIGSNDRVARADGEAVAKAASQPRVTGAFEAAFIAEKVAMDERAVNPDPRAVPIGVPSVAAKEVQAVQPGFRVGDDGLTLVPNHPPFDQIMPIEMPMTVDQPLLRDPGFPLIHDAVTGKTIELPIDGLRSDELGFMPGFDGDPGDFDTEPMLRTFADMTKITNTEDFPYRRNVKLVIHFIDQASQDRWGGCSGTMIDAETVLTAGHCVYGRTADGPDIFDWAEEIYVYPAKDGPDHPFGYARGTHFGAWSGWTSGGSFDADLGLIEVTRAVGFLTGWFGTAWDGSCSWITGHSYYNASYPGEDCPISGLHNGDDMYFWSGHFDSCPGNQLQINTGGGHCFDTVWGGMSGSGAYYIDGESRYVHAACSNSDRMWVGRYCKLWGDWAAFMNGSFIPDARGTSFDLQALDVNAGPGVIVAGSATTLLNHLAVNPTNGTASGTWTYRVYLSTNTDISTADTLLSTQNYPHNFGAMGNVRVNMVQVTIPPATPPGDYYIGVIYDDATDGNSGNNDTDEWDAAPITVIPAPPPNDSCYSPTVIPSKPILPYNPPLLDTTGATSWVYDPLQNCTWGGPNRNSNTVWYSYTPPCDGLLSVDTCGSNYDTVLSVFTGGSCTAPVEIACSDDACSSQSEIINLAVAGLQPLLIEVSDYNLPSGGDLDFNLDFLPTGIPDNDECEDAQWIGVPSNTIGTTDCATTDVGVPYCGDAMVTSPGVWYRVNGTGRMLTASTCNEFSTFDTKISVFCNSCDTLTCVDGNDDDCGSYGGMLSTVSWCSQLGAEYLILVHGFGGQTGGFILDVWQSDLPCTDAVDCGGEAIGACCAGWACEEGGTCGALNNCGGSLNCYCFQTDDGVGACARDFWCNEATDCPNGVSECSAGEVCMVNTCCGTPKCVVPECPGPQGQLAAMLGFDPSEPTASGTPIDEEAELRGEPFPYLPCRDTTQDRCLARGNLYYGDGTACMYTDCPGPLGACCVDGACVETNEEPYCLRLGGEWFAGENCDTFECPLPPPTGACCAPWVCTEGFVCGRPFLPVCNGTFGECSCFHTAERELACLDRRQECGPPCDTTADCDSGRVCTVKTCCDSGDQQGICALEGCPLISEAGQTAAIGESGLVGDQPAGSIASDFRGIAPQSCIEVEKPVCDSYVALYEGDDTTCSEAVCPGPPHACCLPDGRCVETGHNKCVDIGGDPQGPNTTCDMLQCNPLKWAQPPMYTSSSEVPECFFGWDEPSLYGLQQIVADDWECSSEQPVTDIHWWGSYRDWNAPGPPEVAPKQFHIGIWTDVPADGTQVPFSHPGKMIHEWVVEREFLNERPVGCDFFPDHPVEACFRYDFMIPESQWFFQDRSCNIFWVSISAVYGDNPGRNPWGWKTRKHFFNDAAVRIYAPTAPGVPAEWEAGEPIYNPERIPWDMAFVLTTMYPQEACCLRDGDCIDVPRNVCLELNGQPQGEATFCTAREACCLPSGACADLDPLCCMNIDGDPQGPQTFCTGEAACCLPDGRCEMLDPLCCMQRDGVPLPGAACTEMQGCCMNDGSCRDLDPLCCERLGGMPQGPGTGCVDTTLACCDPESGRCVETDPLCCDDVGGIPSPIGSPVCLGDENGNEIDDACEIPPQACCLPGGECVELFHNDCVDHGGDPLGPFTTCEERVCPLLKWVQPPILNNNSEYPDCFWGWDEESVYRGQQIVADDWLCDTAKPITDVHWWGSYYRWFWPEPPDDGPKGFHIGIWTDVPADVDLPYSHPGEMVWEWVVDRRAVNERAVGCDFFPEHPRDTCFRYDLIIPREKWFFQGPACQIYWVSISAIYPDDLPGRSYWGWKTRKRFFNDAAVKIFDPTEPRIDSKFREGVPVEDPSGNTWDMAFVLTSTVGTEACCLENHECLNTVREVCRELLGMPQGVNTACTEPQACCLRDGECILVDPLCCDEFGGTPQGEGTQCTREEACCLPDATCRMLDPLCCEELRGVSQGPGTECGDKVACCLDDGSCEMLDPLCCEQIGGQVMGPGAVCTELQGCCLGDGMCEDLDPLCCRRLGGMPQGAGTGCVDTTVACCLDDGRACIETDPVCCDDENGFLSPISSPICLGDENGNLIDDACEYPQEPPACCMPDGTCEHLEHPECVERGGDPQGPNTDCRDLVCHPLKWVQPPVLNPDSTLPSCFWGWDEPSVYAGRTIVADDFLCDLNRPVTDVHWWGSYTGWRGTERPEIAPEKFQIAIWTDVPAGTNVPFSHPGRLIYEWTTGLDALNERPVGCDFHPDSVADTCFRYDFIIPEDLWFYQGESCEIFWVSIAAVYGDTTQPVEFLWGWKTRPHFFNDDAVRIFVPTMPGVGDAYEQGDPILDSTGRSWDMAFVLTTDCPKATIVDSNPRDGTIDARQPNIPSSSLPRQGIGSPGAVGSTREPITIVLDPPVSGAERCFELCETSVDPLLGPNDIGGVTYLGGGKYEIVLLRAITAGGVTTIQYTGDGSFVEYTFHPANVDGDNASAPSDIIRIIDYINGVGVSPWGVYSEDIDRSFALGPPDILRVIDLLNGAGVYDSWLNVRLPQNPGVCP